MMHATLERPRPGEYVEYYQRYIAMVPEGDVIDHLTKQMQATQAMLSKVDEKQAMHRYAPEKWSVKEVVGHLCDAERVFAYRALRFARGDTTPVPGFEENHYVPSGKFDDRSMASMLEELAAVRAATVSLLAGLPAGASERVGTANDANITVRAIAYIIAGHERHHVGLLETRYGISR